VVDFSVPKNSTSQGGLVIGSMAAIAVIIFSICLFFEPRWMSNDDISMSMLAHGYGVSALSSPNLIFSNVIWGYIVRAIPTINGIIGYSSATLLALFFSGSAILYFLQRLGVSIFSAIVAISLVLMQPTIFPQFTINAGLLTLAGIIGFIAYARSGGMGSLIAASLLAFLGYLVRSQEFYLVLAIASPLLPWGAIRSNRQFKIAFIIVAIAIVSAAIFDRYSYTGDEWRHFQEINSARAPYTDFGAGDQIKKHHEIMDRHNYSANDIDLITSFFFIDPKIADPLSLKAMLSELGPLPLLDGSITSGLDSIKALFSPILLPILFSAILVSFLRPGIPLSLSWALFLLTSFLMGLFGRGGILRVYIPVLTFLYLVSLVYLHSPAKATGAVVGKENLIFRRNIALCVGVVAFIFNYLLVLPESNKSAEDIKKSQEWVMGLPDEPIVSWGIGIPIEYIFPLLANNTDARKIQIYGLGCSTHAPFSVAHFEESKGQGFINRIRSPDGLLIVAPPNQLELLRTWCKERFNGQLRELIVHNAPPLIHGESMTKVLRVWCLEQQSSITENY
jgi:hypothetical protein